ncbi:TAP42-like protein [Fomitopsis serialis]|uniref:TAP42-like protein n=1 Tax=Fomitopsis serialis TaxID=139415 RepID=UPI002008EA86|nr:TAP42-like protein [Neoantrodia serialis]KAH9930760.1 TAP42-like protein [Neoantrodia serialis]
MSDLPLSALFHHAANAVAKANNLPTIQNETQELVHSAVTDLQTLQSRIAALSLFSENEMLEDVATKDLVYLLVPYVLAEVEGRVRTVDPVERLERARRSQRLYRVFLASLETYGIVPEAEKALYAQSVSSITDAQKRRELKINQYQKEKEIKTRIQEVRKHRNHGTPVSDPSSDFDLIVSLLPDPSIKSGLLDDDDDEDDADTEDILRETILLLLRLTYGQAHAQLQSLEQEIQLLRNAPSRPPEAFEDPRRAKDREIVDMWRLDAPLPQGGPDGKGPLTDSSGRPLRPFTILPSTTNREQLRQQVFGPDHRLPTMTVDEYLEIEQQRGNIISGGGPASEARLTTKEQLALDSERDGTLFAEEKVEEKRQQDEKWAQYTDTHPKGAGNTLNRG